MQSIYRGVEYGRSKKTRKNTLQIVLSVSSRGILFPKNKLFFAHIHFLLYLCSEIVGNVRLLLPTLKNDANGMREGRMLQAYDPLAVI